MSDIQAIMNAIGEAGRLARRDYHLTLGELIDKLDSTNQAWLVEFPHGAAPADETSYRGYYSDLAFEQQDAPKTVGEFLIQCKNALGKTYEGYKGGNFVMDKDTPLWTAAYGMTGPAIIDCIEAPNRLILTIKVID